MADGLIAAIGNFNRKNFLRTVDSGLSFAYNSRKPQMLNSSVQKSDLRESPAVEWGHPAAREWVTEGGREHK